MKLQNDLLIRAAKGEYVERTPVWLMRQAGRILPEYRAIRNQMKSFLELVQTPQLAAEVTIQPVDILQVDAAIIFSDILVVPEAMGLPYEMLEKKGPYFPRTVASVQDVQGLRVAQPDQDMPYVMEAISLVKEQLQGRVPLIGFAGAPWTVFSYMVEGSGSKTFSKARRMLYQEEQMAHALLQKIADSTIAYLKAQINAGADLIQIFDSWAGVLPKDHYLKFSYPYIRQICQSIDEVPVTVFAKGAFFALEEMGKLPCDTIGLDWNMDVARSRQLVGEGKTLQGNLDPCALFGNQTDIIKQTEDMLQAFGPGRHIANLGHGVYPDTSVDAVKCFVDTVKEFRH
ncbi:MAG: uroporphyrinogen decarboxylase [Cyclobacteriaceae bacterium]|nr:uroporphyrinogen decarboxylase [Cyclobacteriaceae bacterium]